MREVFDLANELATARMTLLVEGERGTGKELLAREVHRRSDRGAGPFVVLCGRPPERERMLARLRRALGEAEGGTLYVDELADLDREALRELVAASGPPGEPLCRGPGEDPSGRPPARAAQLILATRVDPAGVSPAGRLREELSRRLAWVPIRIPPLRARPDDIGILADHFLARLGRHERRPTLRLSDEARAELRRRTLPGNARELEDVVERAARGATGPALLASDLARPGRASRGRREAGPPRAGATAGVRA
jgi:two-component system NtrC family response regulator